MLKWCVILAVASLSATPVLADPPSPAKSKASDDADKVVCRREEVTGSRLQGHKVCRTKSEWATQQLEARQALDRRGGAQDDKGMGRGGSN